MQIHRAAVGGKDTGDGPQHRGLATAVIANDAQDLTLFHFEADILDSLANLRLIALAEEQILFDGVGFQTLVVNAKVFYFDRIFTHNYTAFK